jgi:AcrR family transcriptional regulator
MARFDSARAQTRLAELIGDVDGDSPKAKRRRRILETATTLFTQQGYRKTSVEDVAEAAGIGKGTVYLHFQTKVDLLVAAIAREKQHYFSRMSPVLEGDLDAEQRLRKWLAMVLVLPNEMPLISRLMSGDKEMAAVFADLPEELLAEGEQNKVDFLGGMIAEVAAGHRWNELELRDRADVLNGLIYFAPLLTQGHVRSNLSVERFATILSDLVIDGLVAHAGGRGE